MIKSLIQLFKQQLEPDFKAEDVDAAEHALRLATAALLVETAIADYAIDAKEQRALESILQRVFELSVKETRQLLRIAREEVETSTSLDQFSRLLDRNLNSDQKFHVMELLWEVSFADGRLDKYEEYLVRKLADLLHVPHKEFIRAKLRVAGRQHQDRE